MARKTLLSKEDIDEEILKVTDFVKHYAITPKEIREQSKVLDRLLEHKENIVAKQERKNKKEAKPSYNDNNTVPVYDKEAVLKLIDSVEELDYSTERTCKDFPNDKDLQGIMTIERKKLPTKTSKGNSVA